MTWLEIYVPFQRLDSGLRILLIVWVLAVALGFAVWIRSRAEG